MTGESMIERVARAISEKIRAFSLGKTPDGLPWNDIARAAIEAMREYSYEMSLTAGAIPKIELLPVGPYNPPLGQAIVERAYLAMIDAAMAEPTSAPSD